MAWYGIVMGTVQSTARTVTWKQWLGASREGWHGWLAGRLAGWMDGCDGNSRALTDCVWKSLHARAESCRVRALQMLCERYAMRCKACDRGCGPSEVVCVLGYGAAWTLGLRVRQRCWWCGVLGRLREWEGSTQSICVGVRWFPFLC